MNELNIESLRERINLLLLFDHVGRAGNGFFLSVFDTHPQVLTCHWVHYIYSYIVTEFGDSPNLDSRKAHEFIRGKSYFRYVFNEPAGEMAQTMRRFGADPQTPLDRATCREAFAALARRQDVISRRDLILAAYAAYALGAGRDLDQVRYVLLSDAVTLRTEHIRDGFSGRVMACAKYDFPQARFLSMVRDPRAMFASNRHQFVNSLGNMYAVTPTCSLRRLGELLRFDLRMGNTVWLYWLWLAAQAGRTINRLKNENLERFATVRNEDLNLAFEPTLRQLCHWLNVPFYEPWGKPDYAPTSGGRPWKGTGAYNSRYQTCTTGPLPNDPPAVADKITGPNRYVTERWRTRLAPHEIQLIEALFFQEMRQLGYVPLQAPVKRISLALASLRPFRGELPSWRWLRSGLAQSMGEAWRRLFYAMVFPVFAVLSRLQLFRLYLRNEFHNPFIKCPDTTLLGVSSPDQRPAKPQGGA